MRDIGYALLLFIVCVTIVLGVAFGSYFTLEWLSPTPCTLHAYAVVRINPSLDALIRPTLMGGENPKLIITEVLACGYEHGDGKTVFYTNDRRDTIADVVHIQDQGPIR